MPDPRESLPSALTEPLGRGVVVGAGGAVPPRWDGADEIGIGPADLERHTAAVDRLHRAWAERTPVVVRLEVEPGDLRRRRSWNRPLWELGGRFDPWTDRLHFLVWNNNYDARADGPPRWWWAWKAAQHGAVATPDGPGDVLLPGGGHAWIDGGPRRSYHPGEQGQPVVIPYLAAECGRLQPPRPATATATAELAPDQLVAVSHASGPARIIAPAGSGKTRVLTERLRHLLVDRGYDREMVLAVAYNKRAQEEMAHRCAGFDPRIQTLNSLGWEILREAQPGVQLLGGDVMAREILERCCPPLDRRANTDPLGPYVDALQVTRQALLDPAAVEAGFDDIPGFARAFHLYRRQLLDGGRADFDEQLYRSCELLLADGELRRRWQARCRHLLVDEFQDLTPLHLLMIRTLAAPALDVFGVGDDDQVIYGFAGADPRFLIDFASLFPGAASHPLEINYRCPRPVIEAATNLLSHNAIRVPKAIRAGRDRDGAGLRVVEHTVDDGAAALLDVVQGWLESGAEPAEVAVLARVNSALLTAQVALAEHRIAINPAMSAEILQRTGVRSALAYLRIALEARTIATPDLEEVLRRPPRGFTREFTEGMRRRPRWSGSDLDALAARTSRRDRGKVHQLLDDLGSIRTAATSRAGTTARALAVIRRVGLDQAMSRLDARSRGRDSHVDDLDALAALAPLHPDPTSFEAWMRQALGRRGSSRGVTLATIHRVKGQEWNCVAIAGVRDGLLPHRLAPDMEEERRILHVGITRGRKAVVVLADSTRPSSFVAQLETMGRAPKVAAPKTRPRPGRARPAREGPRPLPATTGLAIEDSGGFPGVISRVTPDGAYITLATGAQLMVRYGARVKLDGEARVLAAS